jgi:hypothetical protein
LAFNPWQARFCVHLKRIAHGIQNCCRRNAAFAQHGVIFFRDQSITESQHIAFARRWAPININRFFAAHPDHPEIALVSKERDQRDNIGGGYPLLPLVPLWSGVGPMGELDGFFWTTGFGTAAENIIRENRIDHLVVQNVFRNTIGDYAAQRLD